MVALYKFMLLLSFPGLIFNYSTKEGWCPFSWSISTAIPPRWTTCIPPCWSRHLLLDSSSPMQRTVWTVDNSPWRDDFKNHFRCKRCHVGWSSRGYCPIGMVMSLHIMPLGRLTENSKEMEIITQYIVKIAHTVRSIYWERNMLYLVVLWSGFGTHNQCPGSIPGQGKIIHHTRWRKG